jgi:hypothetical protein
MTHANPRYDPEWQQVHDHHVAEWARLEAERNRLIATGAMTSDTYKQVAMDFDYHHRACLDSFKMQHTTVQDYAAWLSVSWICQLSRQGEFG